MVTLVCRCSEVWGWSVFISSNGKALLGYFDARKGYWFVTVR
jgi:hypothetical protein